MERALLISQVVLRMDEITPEEELSISVDGVSGTDNNPLYTLIDGLLDSCALEIYSAAPFWRLPQSQFVTDDILIEAIDSASADSRKIIRLRLGEDFLRIAEIDCADFRRPITEAVIEQSPEGRRQHNRFLRAKESKPVGVLSFGIWNNALCREIDCYSLGASTAVTAATVKASYIAQPGGAQTIPDILLPALEWLAAARAFGARGDANHAAICQKNAQSLLV